MDASLAPSDSYIVLVYFGLRTSDSDGLWTITPQLWQHASLKPLRTTVFRWSATQRFVDYYSVLGCIHDDTCAASLFYVFSQCFPFVSSQTPCGTAATVLDTSGQLFVQHLKLFNIPQWLLLGCFHETPPTAQIATKTLPAFNAAADLPWMQPYSYSIYS